MQEAFSQRLTHLHVQPGRSIADYILNLAKAYRDFIDDPLETALAAVLAASTDDEYNTFISRSWSGVVDDLKLPIDVARDAGVLAPDTDAIMLIRIIFGTISAEMSFSKNVPTDDFLEVMIRQLLRT